jgi:23S rRNA (cytidine2498-2'-O)-methyltransferase
VDPGDLDRRLIGRPGLHHVKTTAGPFLAETTGPFDLIVNDMRMEPGLSASIMNSAVRHLTPDGLAIMSLKLHPEHPLPVIDNAFRVLEKHWERVFVRQLHHNRNEITAVIRPKR